MGYGYRLGVDLPGESRGFIPNSNYYNKVYGENRWSALTIISVAIGQGEVLATPLQIANLSATIANRGIFILRIWFGRYRIRLSLRSLLHLSILWSILTITIMS